MLDLASARRALWKHGSSVPYATATTTDIGEFDFKLMQVVERFFTLGTWRNMWRQLNLTVYGCRLTIPRGFDTCRQISACNNTAPIYSQFHRFAAYGIAVDPVGSVGWSSSLRLADENAQTFVIPTGTFTLRAVATEASAEGLTLIGGYDQDGNELFGATTLALINGVANTTQQYTALPEIQKAVTNHAILLYSVDTTTSVATLISAFAPGETIPSYRQYEVEGIYATDDATNPVVSAVCKLGFVPAIADTDLIIPSNLGALRLGLMALNFEERVDPKNAALYFGPNRPDQNPGQMYGAVDLLDAELDELTAGELSVFQFDRDFAAGSIRSVR